MSKIPMPVTGILLTHLIVSDRIDRSRHFYADVLGGEIVLESEPTIVALANGWIIINRGGGPTEDKPAVTLATPAGDVVSSFLNIRVTNIEEVYGDWASKDAVFFHSADRPWGWSQIRCYTRDPDGHLIEVGQATDPVAAPGNR